MSKKDSKTKSVFQDYAAYGIGALAALGALIVAVLIPDQREMVIGAAGTLAILAFFFTSKGDPWALRLLGVVCAGVVVIFSFLMPEYSQQLLSASGLIAGASIVFV